VERVSRSDSPRKSRTGDKRPQVGKDTWAMDPPLSPAPLHKALGNFAQTRGTYGRCPGFGRWWG